MFVVFAAVFLLNIPGADWELLGTRRVNFRLDHDVILVGARQGAYTAIKIEVAGGMLDMYNVRLTFGDGESWSPPTRLTFREGSWSRTIDLPGPARLIRRIDFAYRGKLQRGAATVRVFGRTGAMTPGDSAVAEWEHLACRPVNPLTSRDSVVDVGDIPFRSIRFENGGDVELELSDVRIAFANGETFASNAHLMFNAGARTLSVDLPGDPRPVRRIDYSYRITGGPQAKTTVHVYGRR